MEESDMPGGPVASDWDREDRSATDQPPGRAICQPITNNAFLDARIVYNGVRYSARGVTRLEADQTLSITPLYLVDARGMHVAWELPRPGQPIVTDMLLAHVEDAEDALWEWAVGAVLACHGLDAPPEPGADRIAAQPRKDRCRRGELSVIWPTF